MGWQDREYNAGGEQMRAYLGNPGALLQYALPIFKSRRLYVHLSFWFLLTAIFTSIDDLRSQAPGYFIAIDILVMLALCLFHELGHMVFARMVGGNHWEWVLWPLGGMVAPNNPTTPKATFVANVGGIVFTGLLLAVTIGVPVAMGGGVHSLRVLNLPIGIVSSVLSSPAWVDRVLVTSGVLSTSIILINLFPCYWFDGGYIWQSVLWPRLGQWKSARVVCMAGMILAVPFLLLALFATSLFGIIFWALVFADCFRRRQALATAGPEVMDEDISYDYMDNSAPRTRRKKVKKSWLTAARKRAVNDQAEQAKIDAILAKVKEKGLHSLSWWEKRTLRKATARQREHDLAERL